MPPSLPQDVGRGSRRNRGDHLRHGVPDSLASSGGPPAFTGALDQIDRDVAPRRRKLSRGLACSPPSYVLRRSETHLVPPGRLKPGAFHRVLQRPPLRRHDRWCPLPRAGAHFGGSVPTDPRVPPSWFLTTLTASSTFGGVSLLHPTADHEVHRVLCSAVPSQGPVDEHASPMFTPSRAFPSPTADPTSPPHRAPSPLRAAARPTSRPSSAGESVA